MNWKTRWCWNTGYSADSVEWCPVELYRHVFVCGTYQLDKSAEGDQEPKKQTRTGKIYLFTVDEGNIELTPIQTIETAGILDQKWCYHTVGNHPTLAAATSIGTIQLYRLVDELGTLELKLWMEHTIGDVLALSLDWSTNKTPSEAPKLVVSDSSGSVSLFRICGDQLQEEFHAQKSHGFEAWIAAFNYWNPDVFYSGGDDCLFKSYDVRVSSSPVTYRSHDAGVTSVRKHLDVEHELLTGSYDEKVRRWDTRKLKSCIAETEVNGGVWRLKYHPHRAGPVVAACMYGGFRLLDADLVVAEYHEHESIAYGADWTHDGCWLATCSFYDCKLHVSEVTYPT